MTKRMRHMTIVAVCGILSRVGYYATAFLIVLNSAVAVANDKTLFPWKYVIAVFMVSMVLNIAAIEGAVKIIHDEDIR